MNAKGGLEGEFVNKTHSTEQRRIFPQKRNSTNYVLTLTSTYNFCAYLAGKSRQTEPQTKTNDVKHTPNEQHFQVEVSNSNNKKEEDYERYTRKTVDIEKPTIQKKAILCEETVFRKIKRQNESSKEGNFQRIKYSSKKAANSRKRMYH